MPRFQVTAPKCARCNTSVYQAEQVIGPSSKPYHKNCLACVVCNKRLDSTLLVEHDAQPFCKNCHREHLGTGKGGFSVAVPLKPSPAVRSPVSSPATLSPSRQRSSTALRGGAEGLHGGANLEAAAAPSTTMTAPSSSSSSSYSTPTRSIKQLQDSYRHALEEEQVPVIRVRARQGGGDAAPPIPSANYYPDRPDRPYQRDYGQSWATERPAFNEPDALREAIPPRGLSPPISRLAESVGDMDLLREPLTPRRRSGEDRTATEVVEDVETPRRMSKEGNRSQGGGGGGGEGGEERLPRETIKTQRISAAEFMRSTPPSSPSSSAAASHRASNHHLTKPSSVAGGDTIGTIKIGAGGLPAPRRPDPSTLTGASSAFKVVAPPRTTTTTHNPTGVALASPLASPKRDGIGSPSNNGTTNRGGGIERLGLGSSIAEAGGGTPLCARCEKAVCE
ncbi:hypothetical protein IE53DRAFT_277248 [Violaceomyces palustris]|uniref:Uncharacterized protein n=1 Tax=Violaceomyces palustris TaxID=1673888 RepID=A0ACD0NMG4_9BASI|nr:hypothetical protein IE53DRAFT_277248 [Violaceomyces palustris]